MTRTIYDTPAPGYMFIAPTPLDTADYPSALAILDQQGHPVFYKPYVNQQIPPYTPVMVTDFKWQPSGLMSYGVPKNPGGMTLYLLDTNFMKVDSITTTGDVDTDGHDFIHSADGRYHLIGTEERIMDCSALLTANGNPGSVNATVVGNVIQRFNPDKTLDFEWRSLDHFELGDVYSQYFTNPNNLDHSHCNSLDIDAGGNYILSFRHLNEITKVNSSTGEIMWRLGGKNGMFTLEGDTMLFTGQHDARMIAGGNLTLFDNGLFNSIPGARAIEYELDKENFIATAVWQFDEPNGLPSAFIGSNRRQANGNTLIDWGGAFPLSESISITEVNPWGNVVMELDFEDSLFVSYRAIKEELPFEIPQPELTCDEGAKTLSAPDGYAYYEWNTGDHTQSIVVEDTGYYRVWVNQGIGYICSETFYVEDLENVCEQLSIVKYETQQWQVYPNPASDKVFIKNLNLSDIDEIKIYNQVGQLVEHTDRVDDYLDISALDEGIYFLEIAVEEQRSIQKLFVSD